MKFIAPLIVVFIAVFILSAGCVSQVKKDNGSGNLPVSTTKTFSPFGINGSEDTPKTAPSGAPEVTNTPAVVNTPTGANTTGSVNSTGTVNTTVLKGMLRISTGGLLGNYPVSVDKTGVGVVTPDKPITLMLEEGDHSVEVCCGVQCEKETVTIQFGKQQIIDFSERLQKNCEFSEPTVRIIGYYLTGDYIMVDVEFINPTTTSATISADLSVGYSYIESRSNNRISNAATPHLYANVPAGDRIMQTVSLSLESGSGYLYDIPTITRISSK